MTEDQRFAATRPDVLVYRTDPLSEDITVAGSIKPELFISSSGTDSDFVVKLIDVFPDDYKLPTGVNPPDGSTACVWSDRKSTRLNSSHVAISYAVFCLKKKNS